MNADSTPKCPQCGAPLPPDAPDGLCPKCVMALNLKTETLFSAAPAPAQAPLTPEQLAPHFPQLEILEYLGRGGMGVVYKARQKSLNRLVALKLLAPERVHDAEFAARFTREAQALAALNHPNIVTIHDFGRADLPVNPGSEAAQQHRPTEAIYYFVMEFVDGVNLRHLLRARKFTPEEALTIVPPLCDALQYAHERGIVHRDIKPENILLAKDGRVKVADFGIAKIVGTDRGSVSRSGDDDSNGIGSSQTRMSGNVAAGHSPAVQDLTEAHQTFGTPGYSAPEQKADPQRVDSRADIYSLGVVFYEMLTGELPGKRIEPPSRKVHIDVRLDEIVLRALESKPELRYQQASVLKTQVETIAETPRNSGRKSAQNENLEQSINLRVRTEVVVGWVAIIGSLAVILYQLRWVFSNKPPRADFLEQMVVPALVLIAGISSVWAGRRKTLSSNGDDPSAGQSQSRLTSAATELPEAKRPWQLIAVALVFIAVGIPSIYNLGKSIAYGSLPIGADTGLLHIPIGVGLLRLRPWWRKTAMFLLLLIAAVFVIGGLFALSGLELAAPRGAVVFGYWIKSELAGGFINLLMLILITWQYLVLVRPDAKALFNKRGFDRPVIEWAVLLLAVAGSAGLALATQSLRDSSSTPALTTGMRILAGSTGIAFIVASVFMILRVSRPASKKPNAKALAAIDAWLALMDKRDYAGTWQTATPMFRRVVSETEWVDKCVKIRKPLGNVIARELKTSRSAFFGKHFKAQFATRFDGGFDAVETVTFSHQADGGWKALTYIVRIGTQLARDWKLAFWIVFATMLFASLLGTGINLAVKRATETRQMKRGALQNELGNSIATLLGNERHITYSQLIFEHVPNAPWEAVVHFSGLQSWRDPYNQALPQPRKISGEIVLDYQPPNEWAASGTGDLYGLGAVWYTAMSGFPEWPDARVLPRAQAVVSNTAPYVSFGPSITRTIQTAETKTNLFLNLDSGELLTPPDDIRVLFQESYSKRNSWNLNSDSRAGKMAQWLRDSGANLMISDSGSGERLEIREAAALAPNVVSNDVAIPFGFDEADPQYLFDRIKPMLDGTLRQRQREKTIWLLQPGFDEKLNRRQDAFCFETTSGTLGILQILTPEDKPRGIRIRYKLVQRAIPATHGYTIERGDTAVGIARRFGMSVAVLKALNPAINWTRLRVGQEARVYGAEPVGVRTNAAARIANNSARHEFEFRWVATNDDTNSPADDLTSTRNNGAGERIVEHYRVLRDVVLSDRDVESAGFSEYQSTQKTLEVFLQPEARERFAKATAQNIGRQLAIIWRSNVISAPIIESALPGGRVQITGSFSDAEAKELLDLLNHRTAKPEQSNNVSTGVSNNSNQAAINPPRQGADTNQVYSSFDSPKTNDTLSTRLVFSNAPVERVLDCYQAFSGRTVIHSTALPDVHISLAMPRPLSRIECLRVLDSTLAANGIAIVLSGEKSVKAVAMPQLARENAPEINLVWNELPDSSSFMTTTIRPSSLKAAEVVPMLMPFAKLPNSIIAVQDQNLVVLRDFSSAIRQQLKVLRMLEGLQPSPSDQKAIRSDSTHSSFDLKNDENDKRRTMDMVNAPLAVVLKLYQDLSQRAVIQGPLPAVLVTVHTASALTSTEMLRLLDTALAENGIAMVLCDDNSVKPVPVARVMTESFPEVDLPWDQLPDSSSPMMRIVRLKNVRAVEVVPVLAPFSKLRNSILPIQSGNLLILRDYSSAIRQQLKLLETLEQNRSDPK